MNYCLHVDLAAVHRKLTELYSADPNVKIGEPHDGEIAIECSASEPLNYIAQMREAACNGLTWADILPVKPTGEWPESSG